jgi:hypothetical protein
MPRPSPFLESDLKERQKFGFGPADDARAVANVEGKYDEALKSLVVSRDLRRRCEEELDCILRRYKLERLVELQETPGRKAQAFQKERRLRKRRERARKRLEKHVEQDEQASARRAWGELQRTPRLPPALEDEKWREVLTGLLPDAALAKLSRQPSNPGRITSHALTYAVRGLQDLASRYRRDWAWATGDAPPRPLIKFIRDVLVSADITCPDEQNQDRLVALMVSRPMRAPETARPSR